MSRPLGPALRTGLFYTVLFMPAAVSMVYLGPWLAHSGLGDPQIALINAAPILALLVISLAVGRLADRAQDWRQVIVMATWASGVLAIGLFWAEGFWPILIVWTLTTMTQFGVVPVLDAAALRMSTRSGADFGTLRAWGTIGFLVMLVGTGYLALWFGPVVFLPLFVSIGLFRAVVALGLPAFRAPAEAAPTGGATRLRQVMRPWFLLPLAGWALIHASHFNMNVFQALIWERQGIRVDVIGLLVALAALSEAAMFFLFFRFSARLRARTWILISALVTALRWAAMAFAPGIGWLILLQSLHGITYGLGFLACTLFIANWTSEDIAAEAQGFFVTLQQGMSVASVTLFGLMLTGWDEAAFWLGALLAAVGSLAIAASLRLRPPEG